MKIQSRKEFRSKEGRHRLGKYKEHRTTALLYDPSPHELHLVSEYLPTAGCPADARPWFSFAFGMDERRFVLTLDYSELLNLKREIDHALEKIKPRRVK